VSEIFEYGKKKILSIFIINSLKIITTLFCKIPPNLPFPKGGIIPLFGKEGQGRFSE
jgi:hypothetical protein